MDMEEKTKLLEKPNKFDSNSDKIPATEITIDFEASEHLETNPS